MGQEPSTNNELFDASDMLDDKIGVVESGGHTWVQNGSGSRHYTKLNKKQSPKRKKTFKDGSVDDAVKLIFGG